jgi:transposase-like protein
MSNANDDKSPLIDLLTCIECKVTMKISRSDPDENGSDLVRYRCVSCGRIELVRLIRRSRDAAWAV